MYFKIIICRLDIVDTSKLQNSDRLSTGHDPADGGRPMLLIMPIISKVGHSLPGVSWKTPRAEKAAGGSLPPS